MNEMEIIQLLSNCLPVASATIGAITGSLFTAIFLRRNTSVQEFEKIKAGFFREVAEDLLESGKMTYTEFYKANNFLKIAEKADKYAKDRNDRNEGQYSFDWFIRFYEAAGNISEEIIQEIWAKVLSGEICHPGHVSLKTLDILKNIGKKEAELFEKICTHAIYFNNLNVFIPSYRSYLDNYGVTYPDLLCLDELGLINSDSMLVLNTEVTHKDTIMFHNGRIVVTAKSVDKEKADLKVNQYPLTVAGRELFFLNEFNISDGCLKTLAKELSYNKSFSIGLHKIISLDGKKMQYSEENLLD